MATQRTVDVISFELQETHEYASYPLLRDR